MTTVGRPLETVGVMHDGRLTTFHLKPLTERARYTEEPKVYWGLVQDEFERHATRVTRDVNLSVFCPTKGVGVAVLSELNLTEVFLKFSKHSLFV
jgi:hypothetical protein